MLTKWLTAQHYDIISLLLIIFRWLDAYVWERNLSTWFTWSFSYNGHKKLLGRGRFSQSASGKHPESEYTFPASAFSPRSKKKKVFLLSLWLTFTRPASTAPRFLPSLNSSSSFSFSSPPPLPCYSSGQHFSLRCSPLLSLVLLFKIIHSIFSLAVILHCFFKCTRARKCIRGR